ncbi:MAG: ABC-F family ATP-binding cassette domain-containing protein [Bdellovibrionales bacterium]|nr:ABC-F family ATP-binding cassette domain-containing protein [Bdellovibrionales bacterium]
MSEILCSLNNIDKSFGAKNLFSQIKLSIYDKERIAIVGPNGSGKSTLLKIMAGLETVDNGDVSVRKNIQISYVPQEESFNKSVPILEIVKHNLTGLDDIEKDVQASIALSQCGFEDFTVTPQSLSGGWKKRLQIACALAASPDLLLLDEPTNHMDWESIEWLESLLNKLHCTYIVISHDRAFLDNSTKKTIEISPLYSDGYKEYKASYSKFLDLKAEVIENQLNLQSQLENKARREVSWLRAGVKARTTKSQARIKEAHNLLENLKQLKSQNNSQQKANIEIEQTGRKTKKLIEAKNLSFHYPDQDPLFENLNFKLGPKQNLGLLGMNGSGKSTFINVITKALTPSTGEVVWAEDLKVVFIDQHRESIDNSTTILKYLGDGADRVIFNQESVHVASYASKFLFPSEKLNIKIEQLSGGEKARLVLAKKLLQPADVLILDEPTNDLDIDTIEHLEEILEAFKGLLIIVSHDRYFLSRLCDIYLSFGRKNEFYADIDQWLKDRKKSFNEAKVEESHKPKNEVKPKATKKLSYKEKFELENIEPKIQKLEEELSHLEDEIQKPKIIENHQLMGECTQKISELQTNIASLYDRWQELEEKA